MLARSFTDKAKKQIKFAISNAKREKARNGKIEKKARYSHVFLFSLKKSKICAIISS
jgi:uncharacterized protein YdeI (YjbR/CyaY-like superfamily)